MVYDQPLRWKRAERRKAFDVARAIQAHRNFLHRQPTLVWIANRFDKSTTWAAHYKVKAIEFGFLDD